MKKIISAFVLILIINTAYSQISIGGGASMLKVFGVPAPYAGMHLLVEYPVDDETSYFGRINFFGKQKGEPVYTYADAIDFVNTTPGQIPVSYQTTFNYTTIELGRRYYFGNGYDYGFGAYGGTQAMVAFNQAKVISSDYDKTKYRITGLEPKGAVFSIAAGLSGGIKNDFTWGTLYLDGAFHYLFLGQSTNVTAANGFSEFGGQILFSFTVGYRKTIF